MNNLLTNYNSNGGEYVICDNPKCESHHYLNIRNSDLIELFGENFQAEKDDNGGYLYQDPIENPDELDYFCPNCGELFDAEEKTDPKENDVRDSFEEAYHPLPDDEIMVNEMYSAFTDSMYRDGQISSLMYNNMGAFF